MTHLDQLYPPQPVKTVLNHDDPFGPVISSSTCQNSSKSTIYTLMVNILYVGEVDVYLYICKLSSTFIYVYGDHCITKPRYM
jgi:hypothetical protein